MKGETKTMINTGYPNQNNSCDCGMFMLRGIEFLSREEILDFGPEDMPYFRILIAYELIIGKLLI